VTLASGELPLTDLAVQAFENRIRLAGQGPLLFPSTGNPSRHQMSFRTAAQHRARPEFRIFGFRICARRTLPGSLLTALQTNGSRSSFGKATRRCSSGTQMKLQMKREASSRLNPLNRQANEQGQSNDTDRPN
jgi:hypothetical protein